jgi:GMP synthase (glutamine-hydrolysing)
MSHHDSVVLAPDSARVTACTPATGVAAFEIVDRNVYAVQFHPEVSHTTFGRELLTSFLTNIAGIEPSYDDSKLGETLVAELAVAMPTGAVVCGLSGGVDSTVAAVLVHRAVGERLHCVFVDTGLLREGEVADVLKLTRALNLPVQHVDASELFFARLAGVTDPEEKRKIIGAAFVDVFRNAAEDIADATYLVQGTLRSDIVESGADGAGRATIKSHHNVGGLPAELGFDLVEPLRDLYKDEVRALGEQLDIPVASLARQPFPGPGLGIRILGEVTPERTAMVRAADAIVREEIERADAHHDLWQYFAVLVADARTVGVQGDSRTYGHPIVVRIVTSRDAMTADWGRVPADVLDALARRIPNEVPGVNRVVLDLTGKPPGTIEWE